MVFFNYSTMQVASKIVYYGPGLCGKTTNLQYVYDQTTSDSRGEMVSLQTETDRTLFFDLLPIDLGSIGGFKTKIQLYTVPGQVFYNTTRKLVLKGVDGIVFVADSQPLMLDANIDSMNNLAANLDEIGLKLTDLPVVLQFNKRDLPDVSSVEELNRAINRHDWPYHEACALTGEGVFETLSAIAKLTLASLKERLGEAQSATRPHAAPGAGRPPAPPRRSVSPSPGSSPPDAAATEPERATATSVATAAEPANGHAEMSRELELKLPKKALHRARRVSFTLRLEDEDQNVVGDLQRGYDLESASGLEELLLRLRVSVSPGEDPGGSAGGPSQAH